MDEKTREKTLPATEDFRANDDKDARSIVDTIDHAAEKRVLRKVDLNLITIFGLTLLSTAPMDACRSLTVTFRRLISYVVLR